MSVGSQVPLGVYRGRGCGIVPIEKYESFVGRPVTYVEDFVLESPTTWAQFEGAYLTNSAQAGVWNGQLGTRILALSLSACCGNSIGSGGKTWADEAAGLNDAHWTALGNYLIANGLGSSLLRVGREFNGSWYQWKVLEGGQASYIAGYKHVVDLLSKLPGAEFRFCWNPILGVGNLTSHGVESCYPGDAYVDEIGIDVYDWGTAEAASAVPISTQESSWSSDLTIWDSIRGWYGLALAHGKPLSFPEWGLVLWKSGGTYSGNGDDALFVTGMAQFISGCSTMSWAAMWEDPWGAGVADPDNLPGRPIPAPQARAAFLSYFAP